MHEGTGQARGVWRAEGGPAQPPAAPEPPVYAPPVYAPPPPPEERPPAPVHEPPQPPPAPARRGTGCGYVGVALLSAVIVAVIMSLLVPTLLGVDPIALLRGKSAVGAINQRVVKIVSAETSEEPIVAVAQKVTPSVVNISVQQQVGFGQFGAPTQLVQGTGSGVIMSSDGYILSNDHVVGGANQIFVTIGGDANVPGKVVGRDPDSDLAVIKVDRAGLVPAEWGDSDKLQVGQWAVAIGSPFGLEHSVTAGIVSALHRNQTNGQTTYTDLIQTDAAINPGNSGGALADIQGKVIGINALIEAPSNQFGAPQNAGIGFAIPSNFAVKIAQQLIRKGVAQHPYLGIAAGTVTPELVTSHKLPVSQGAIIVSVSPGGPAAKAGIQVDDILVAIGSHPVTTIEDIFAALRAYNVGDTVPVTLFRAGKKIVLNATLAEKPKSLLPSG
jgi:putative serine protease PepD